MADTVPIRKSSSIFDQLNEMHNRIMSRAFEIFERNGSAPGRDLENWTQAESELMWKPAIELREKDGKFEFEAAVSGMDAKDIDVEVSPEDIVIKAQTQHEHKDHHGTVHYCEFQSGRMFRSIHLPKRINPDRVRAEFKNGLLRVTADIAEEAQIKRLKPEAA